MGTFMTYDLNCLPSLAGFYASYCSYLGLLLHTRVEFGDYLSTTSFYPSRDCQLFDYLSYLVSLLSSAHHFYYHASCRFTATLRISFQSRCFKRPQTRRPPQGSCNSVSYLSLNPACPSYSPPSPTRSSVSLCFQVQVLS